MRRAFYILAIFLIGRTLLSGAAGHLKKSSLKRPKARPVTTTTPPFNYNNATILLSDGTEVKGKITEKDTHWISVHETDGSVTHWPTEEVVSINGVPPVKIKNYSTEAVEPKGIMDLNKVDTSSSSVSPAKTEKIKSDIVK